MKKYFTLLFLTVATTSLWAQSFQDYFASQPTGFYPYDVTTCANGGSIICGTNGNGLPAVAKIDASGNVTWSENLNLDIYMHEPVATSIGELSGGGYYVLITDEWYANYYYGNIPYVLVKLNSSGNVTSTKVYYTTFPAYIYWQSRPRVKQLSNGNFIFNMSLWQDMGVFMTDNAGNLQWSRTITNDTLKNPSLDISICSDGGVIALGKRNNDMHLVKMDVYGNILWSRIFADHGNSYTRGKDVIKTADGKMVIAGLTGDTTGSVKMGFLMKIDNNGNISWFKNYYNTSEQPCFSKVVELPNSDLMVSGSDNTHLIMAKMDANGNLLATAGVQNTNPSYYPFQGLKVEGNEVIFSDPENSLLFSVDPNLGFCGADYLQLTQVNANYNPTIITGQITTGTAGISVGVANCTATSTNLLADNWCTLFSVNDVSLNVNVTVSPNPAGSFSLITVEPGIKLLNARLEVYDILGRKLDIVEFSGNSARVERKDAPGGIYFYKVLNNEKVISTGKLIFE
jgi:hypothetical protein